MATAVEELLGLLRAAAGEASLHNALGRWRQRVSTLVGELQAQVAALPLPVPGPPGPPGGALDSIQVLRSGGNQPLSIGTDLVLNSVAEQEGVAYNNATGVFTLTGGKKYRLSAHGTMVNFGGSPTVIVGVEWVDAGTNSPIVPGVSGFWTPINDVNNTAPSPTTEVVHRPLANQDVKLRVTTAAVGLTAELLAGFFTAIVQQISS